MNQPLRDLGIDPWNPSEVSQRVLREVRYELDPPSLERVMPIEHAQLIYKIKEKFKVIFWLPIGKAGAILRPLTRGEYHIYTKYIEQYNSNLDRWPLLKHCILYPLINSKEYDLLFGPKALAGWVDTALSTILNVTMFDKPSEMQIIKDTYKNGIANGEFNLSTEWLLRGNLPGLTKEQMDNMTAIEIMESISAVNHLTNGQVDFNFITSDSDKKKLQASAMDAALRAATPQVNLH